MSHHLKLWASFLFAALLVLPNTYAIAEDGEPTCRIFSDSPNENKAAGLQVYLRKALQRMSFAMQSAAATFRTNEGLIQSARKKPNQNHYAKGVKLAARNFAEFKSQQGYFNLSSQQTRLILEQHLHRQIKRLKKAHHTHSGVEPFIEWMKEIEQHLPAFSQLEKADKLALWNFIQRKLGWESTDITGIRSLFTDREVEQYPVDLERQEPLLIARIHQQLAEDDIKSLTVLAYKALSSIRPHAVAESESIKLLRYVINTRALTSEFWKQILLGRAQGVCQDYAFRLMSEGARYFCRPQMLEPNLAVITAATNGDLSLLNLNEKQRYEIASEYIKASKLPRSEVSLADYARDFAITSADYISKFEEGANSVQMLELWHHASPQDLGKLAVIKAKHEEERAQLPLPKGGQYSHTKEYFKVRRQLLSDATISWSVLEEIFSAFEKDMATYSRIRIDDWDHPELTLGNRSVLEFVEFMIKHPTWFYSAPPPEFFLNLSETQRMGFLIDLAHRSLTNIDIVGTPDLFPHTREGDELFLTHAKILVRQQGPGGLPDHRPAYIDDISAFSQAKDALQRKFLGQFISRNFSRVERFKFAFETLNPQYLKIMIKARGFLERLTREDRYRLIQHYLHILVQDQWIQKSHSGIDSKFYRSDLPGEFEIDDFAPQRRTALVQYLIKEYKRVWSNPAIGEELDAEELSRAFHLSHEDVLRLLAEEN